MGRGALSTHTTRTVEDVILKMKANGVNIIACYVLWMHHEQIEGQFDWTDNKDLRAFLQLCNRSTACGLIRVLALVSCRVRNGATPDWILLKKNIEIGPTILYTIAAARLYARSHLE